MPRLLILTGLVAFFLSVGTAFAGVAQPQRYTARDRAILLAAYKHPQFDHEVKLARAAGVPDFWKKYGERVPDFVNAAVFFEKLEDPPNIPTADETAGYPLVDDPENNSAVWQSAERFLGNAQTILKLAHSGAKCLKLSPMLRGTEDPLKLEFPELGGCRRSAKVITLESLSLARHGKWTAAVKNQQATFGCADRALSDIGLSAYVVGSACQQHAFDGLQDILRISKGNPEVCTAVEAGIIANYHNHPLGDGLRSDCAFDIAQIQYWHKGGPEAFSDMSDGAVDPNAVKRPDVYNAILDLNGVFVVKHELPAIAVADRPYPEAYRLLTAQEASLDQYRGIDFTFAQEMLPTPSKAIGVHARIQAAATITRAACKVFLYKSKHGTYPSTLADATSTAIDPFYGKPLGYRREGSGFVIYSVGPTGKYDGGDFDNKKQHEEVFRYSN